VSAVIGAVLWGPYYAYGYGYPYLAAPNPEIPLASDAIRGSLISKKQLAASAGDAEKDLPQR